MASRQFFSFLFKSVLLGVIVAALMLFLVPNLRQGDGFAQNVFNPGSSSASRISYKDAVNKAGPAVVNIYSVSIENDVGFYRSRPRERTSLGSGVIMTESGYILTNNHVVQNADSIVVAVQDGQILEAHIVGYDQYTDLAVLKVDDGVNLHVIPQSEDPDVAVGDMVMAIGNPFDLGQTVTHGIVSRAGRKGLSNFVDFIQTDAVLNQGNSGGALVDSNGVLVGITNANFQVRDGRNGVRNVDGINFAVPYELAKRVMDEIVTDGRVTRGQLGFIGQEIANRPGVTVTAVAKQSPAAKAGLKPNDVILAINDIKLESASKTLDMIAETEPGTQLKLQISRDGELMDMNVTVAELGG
ncbi:trypsin-like peptidase domain-containing protein [Salinimonas profundi]